MPTDVWLQWDDGLASPVSTRVERSPDDNQNFSEVANVAPPAQNHKDAALADGTYFYRTRHEITPGVFTGYSNEDSITVGSAPGPAVLVEDDFNVPDRAVTGHTPTVTNVPGDTWESSVAGHNIRDNEFQRTGGSTSAYAALDCGMGNGVITVTRTATVDTDNNHSIVARKPNTTSDWGIQAQCRPGQPEIRIREKTGGYTNRGTLTIPAPVLPVDLSLTLNGDQATFEYGGESLTVTLVDYAAATNTIAGLDTSNLNSFDNFKVTELP